MEEDWAPMIFETKEWRSGRILASTDEIQMLLDDQIVKAQVHTSRLGPAVLLKYNPKCCTL